MDKTEQTEPYLVLGLDLGIASCGFFLIDRANRGILEIGSRLFPKPQTKKGHVSLAVIRRGFAVSLDILKARGMIGRRIARGLTGPDSMSAAAGFINCNLNGR